MASMPTIRTSFTVVIEYDDIESEPYDQAFARVAEATQLASQEIDCAVRLDSYYHDSAGRVTVTFESLEIDMLPTPAKYKAEEV